MAETPQVIVVGAGAAGIIAAWKAATMGARVLLLEKTPRLGTKILISGGGKCNITHDGPIEDLLRAFRANEARFLRPSAYRFPNTEIIRLLEERGLEVYTRPDGRIFPVVQTAKDVVAILRGLLEEAGVDVRLSHSVTGLVTEGSSVVGVLCGESAVKASSVVLSVGGSSYPNSGTTGDGWKWAKAVGHRIVPVRAALAPMDTDAPFGRFPGVALRECTLKARQDGKEIARWYGDLLFTHHGVSGPCALGISREVAERRGSSSVTLEVDLVPDMSFEELSRELIERCEAHPVKSAASLVEKRLPSTLVDPFLCSLELNPKMPLGQMTRKSRNKVLEALKAWQLGEVTGVPLAKGECVSGGVSLDEVEPKTMRSLKADGLYLCGEMLDIAGPVGGYNLQAAFSTGFVAGEAAALAALSER